MTILNSSIYTYSITPKFRFLKTCVALLSSATFELFLMSACIFPFELRCYMQYLRFCLAFLLLPLVHSEAWSTAGSMLKIFFRQGRRESSKRQAGIVPASNLRFFSGFDSRNSTRLFLVSIQSTIDGILGEEVLWRKRYFIFYIRIYNTYFFLHSHTQILHILVKQFLVYILHHVLQLLVHVITS